MYLVFDGVSREGYIGLFHSDTKPIVSKRFRIAGNESTMTISLIDSFLKEQKVKYEEIENIICVVGPGSFTGIRTISLVINTLAYIYENIYITPVNVFDLYVEYPIVCPSSKRDLFVKMEKGAIIEVVQNADFEAQYSGEYIFGDVDISRFNRKYTIDASKDYEKFVSQCQLQQQKKIAPLYMKKPNIS